MFISLIPGPFSWLLYSARRGDRLRFGQWTFSVYDKPVERGRQPSEFRLRQIWPPGSLSHREYGCWQCSGQVSLSLLCMSSSQHHTLHRTHDSIRSTPIHLFTSHWAQNFTLQLTFHTQVTTLLYTELRTLHFILTPHIYILRAKITTLHCILGSQLD